LATTCKNPLLPPRKNPSDALVRGKTALGCLEIAHVLQQRLIVQLVSLLRVSDQAERHVTEKFQIILSDSIQTVK